MSVGLVNDATQIRRDLGHHTNLLPQPEPEYPSQLSYDALASQGSEAGPPHAENTNASGVAFEQAVRGIHLFYAKFRAVEAAYNTIYKVLAGKQDPPIIHIPTGSIDEEGNQIIYELDLKQTLPERVTEDERLAAVRKQLGPWNNYFVQEYRKCVTKLAQAATTVTELMVPAPQAQQAQQARQAPVARQPGTRVVTAPMLPPTQ
jgi:hypothetical protein